jgi:uncharacterized OsmC-like protein
MDRDALRARQAPLKQQYRESSASGVVTARAGGRLAVDDIACVVQSWHGETMAGLHPATGGSGALACSADLLLEALVACAGVTLSAVATSMGVAVHGGRIVAEGRWDARGTLGVDRSVAVGVTDIVLRFELDTAASDADIQRLLDTTERCCVIFQTLRSPPRLTMERHRA